MELGTAIFLSAVFLGMVALLVATKDRWNWKKVLLWPLAILLGLSVIGGAGFGVNSWIQDRPRKELGLWGIQLEASLADVKFAKGEPLRPAYDYAAWIVKNEALKGSPEFDIVATAYKKAKAEEAKARETGPTAPGGADPTWLYLLGRSASDDGSYVVRFQDGKVRYIMFVGPRLYAPSIREITRYSGLEQLIEKFGQPSYVSRSKDDLRRWLSFEKFNVAFELEKNDILALGVYDSSTGPIKYTDEAE